MFNLPEKILGSDWFLSLIIGIFLLLITQLNFLQPLEQTAYDLSIQHINRYPGDKVAVIAIDDRSVAQLGDLALNRTLLAQVIDLVAPYSQVISTTLDLSQPQKTPEQNYLDELINFYSHSNTLNQLPTLLEQLDTLINKANRIRTRYRRDKKMLRKLYDFYKNEFLSEKLLETLTTFEEKLQVARVDLNSDQRLANSFINAGNIVLGMPFILDDVHRKTFPQHTPNPSQEGNQTVADERGNAREGFILEKSLHQTIAPDLPDYVQKHHLKTIRKPFESNYQISQPPLGNNAIPPLTLFGQHVAGIGYFSLKNRSVNPRKIPLIIKYNQNYFPSLPLLLVAKSLSFQEFGKNKSPLTPLFQRGESGEVGEEFPPPRLLSLSKHGRGLGGGPEIEVQLGKGVRIEQWQVNTDSTLHTWPFFYEPSSLSVDSYLDVLQGTIPATQYQDKIVLLGKTTSYQSDKQSTPVGEMPSVLVLAEIVTSLLNQDFFKVPSWAIWLQTSLFILVLAYIGFLFPRLGWQKALFVNMVLIAILGVIYFSLLKQGALVQLMPVILLIPCGHLSLQTKRAIVAYQDAFRLHPDAVESNRLLGLAFQGQGHLDLAFEKFRLCPPNEMILGLLYNLALDYEQKRQFRRARAVYRFMMSHNPDFRDISQRLERLHYLKKPKSPTGNLDDWLQIDNNEKPVLGRYRIERRLGKGAMGIVYLGQDTKLNRLVAIKTLPLSQEFEAEELQEATIRFFREAEAAGRLTHPSIISIYEAGEEQDLAYIAMEFFKGGNLVPYTVPDNLLPIPQVVDIIIKAAEALDYAHNQGVVHRDIKPANIMYNQVTGQIKMTDFGIARITDSNKTKTGIILGTPSYMSPEQLAGKSIDGRTDVFSLGVMLYQLLTGVLPFQADSLTTLMFKITNESPVDITTVRADVPLCLKRVVEMALQKEVNARLKSGAEFVRALQDCQTDGEI